MPSHTTAGTFTTGQRASTLGDMQSGVVVIPTGTTNAKLTISGASAQNRVKTQKSTNNGASWADVTTYNNDQSGTLVPVTPGEHWRLVSVAKNASSEVRYKFTCES